jgi:hypothetical protein
MKKFIPVAIAVLLFYVLQEQLDPTHNAPLPAGQTSGATSATTETFRGGSQVQGSGVVSRILADDNTGSRHQRFILRLDSGRTLLIAHNIDIAPRLSALRVGDRVGFSGVFEANDQGGVIHWTHRDPDGRHQAGWLQYNDRLYQ